jgi:hypothetical protein
MLQLPFSVRKKHSLLLSFFISCLDSPRRESMHMRMSSLSSFFHLSISSGERRISVPMQHFLQALHNSTELVMLSKRQKKSRYKTLCISLNVYPFASSQFHINLICRLSCCRVNRDKKLKVTNSAIKSKPVIV